MFSRIAIRSVIVQSGKRNVSMGHLAQGKWNQRTQSNVMYGLCGALALASYGLWQEKGSKVDAVEETSQVLSPQEWKPLTLVGKQRLTHDTHLYRFGYPAKEQKANLPIASCVMIQAPAKEGGEPSAKPYTPIRESEGSMEF